MAINSQINLRSSLSKSYDGGKEFLDSMIQLFHESKNTLGDPRNTIKIIDFEGKAYVVKSFRKPNLINKIVYRFFRKSKAKRSYENALYLTKKDILTPEPIAFQEELNTLSLGSSYYISAYWKPDFTYRELINDEQILNKKLILKEYAVYMHQMHESQVYFLDNSPGNTLIRMTGEHYEFALVDLNRMKFYKIPYQDRLKNFERLSPKKWMYEVMGAEYAKISNKDEKSTIEDMWDYCQKFQAKFLKKRERKRKLKALFK